MIMVENLLITILALIVIVIFFGAIYAFVRSIWIFIFSHWEVEEKKKAWNWIRFMIIWVMLTIVLIFFFKYILKFLGVVNYEDYSAENIFARVSQILQQIFDAGHKAFNDNFGSHNWTDTISNPNNVFDSSNYEL